MKKIFVNILILLCLALSAENNARIDSLHQLLESEISEKEKVKIYVDLGALYSVHSPHEAEKFSEKAYSLAIKIKDTENEANAINNLAVISYYQGNYDKALKFYQQALKIDTENGRTENISTRLSNIGVLYADQGQFDKAIEYYNKALKIDEELNNKKNIAVRLNNIALIYTRWGRYNSALDNFQKALEIDKELGNQEEIAIRLNNIGMIFLYLKKFEQSIEYFNQALEIDNKLNNKKNIAIRYNNLGRAFNSLNNYKKAITYYNKALEINEKIKNKRDIAIGLKNMGETYIELNKHEEALQKLNSALKINIELGIKSEISKVYQLIGVVYNKKKNYNKAINNYRKSIELSLDLNLFNVSMKNHKDLSEMYKIIGKNDISLKHFKQYTILKDSLSNEENSKQISLIQAKYESEKKEREIVLLNKDKELSESKIKQQRILIYIFILIVTVLAVSFLLVFLYLKNKEYRTKNKLKEELNMYMQKALRQQMNPHFIFNTLTSIQYFILQNNIVESNKYLSKFAKLMRLTLDNSQHNTISIEEELESLKLYLELESLRFETKFDFEINKKNIEINDYQIPTLLIQPFVENAIWHGLMTKKEKGKILIEISKNNNIIVCKIEDNGIGRKKANEIKNKKNKTHQSLGTKITKARLDLINSLYDSDMNIIYTDLYDGNGNAIGTKVEIYIPVFN